MYGPNGDLILRYQINKKKHCSDPHPSKQVVLGHTETGDHDQGLEDRITRQKATTPPKFNMEPENDGFQGELTFLGTSFQVPC